MTIGVLIFFLGAISGWAGPSAIEALCGPPPASKALAADEIGTQESALRRMEREMPPVTDQGISDWCFAHVAAGLLEHHFHQTTGLPYDARNLISPIDLAEDGNFYLEQNIAGMIPVSGSADFNGKQDPIDVLLCVQANGAVRSVSQLLTATSDEGSAERTFARFITEEQSKIRLQRESDSFRTSETALRSNPSVMNLLFNWEVLRSWVQGDFSRSALQHYDQIVKVSGAPDIRFLPFVINRYSSRDPIKVAAKIRQVLQSGEPAAVFFRGQDVPGDWQAVNPGETHIMTIVGAAYLGNRPVVRLRNSWGAHWADQGYITSPADEFLKWQKSAADAWRGEYLLTWISAEPSNPKSDEPAGKLIRLEDDYGVFTGSIKDQLQSSRGNLIHHYRYITGTRFFFNGRTEAYQDGKRVVR